MRILRSIGFGVLCLLAAIGVLSGVGWAANALGVVQPLIVVSGSMAPGIKTGDLVVSIPEPVDGIEVGDIVTLRSTLTQRLVTHRVIAIDQDGDGYRLQLKGDANDEPDPRSYAVASDAAPPVPWVVIPGAGRFVEAVGRPAVAIPLLVALAALVGLTLLPSPKDDESHDVDDTTAEGDAEATPASARHGGPS
ncbi:signal peptidase I [Plantibacter sp. ME-Dv--P-122b]|uniref:signal peptidase I n=1 Tax=Plantibacter sp. ME-Dv--P-122b TaxID=3040300 RepID=UPI00254CE20E|nr:signal peptidase I [Plantibacter sp. ME-Dv--P-122b]